MNRLTAAWNRQTRHRLAGTDRRIRTSVSADKRSATDFSSIGGVVSLLQPLQLLA
jgi:hypothetical protein